MTYPVRQSDSRENGAACTLYAYWWRYSFGLPGEAVIRD